MPVSKTSRLLALFAVTVLLVAGACNRGGDDDEADVTDPPERTPSVEAVADFQLVGTIDEAFAGQLPPVDIPEGATAPETTDAPATTGSPGATATPVGTPVGETPTRGGILRMELDAASEDLTEACGVGENSVVHVYWTTATFFEPPDVLDDVEDEIEDRTAGISGTIFRASGLDERDDDEVIDTPTPIGTGSPAATTSPTAGSPTPAVQAADCILVAKQIGFGQTALPTPAPVRRTATPSTPAPTATPTPTPTTEPTEEPDDTPTPTPVPPAVSP